jgi:sentrin-specific protease 1
MITSFRFKLASILLCWKTNTAAMITIIEESDDDTNGDPDDVQILESLDDIKKQSIKSHYLLKINTDH